MLLLAGGCHSTVMAPHLPSEEELGTGKAVEKSSTVLALERDNSAFPVL